MSKWNMIVDLARCNSCNNCVLATKDEYAGNQFPGYSATSSGLGFNLLTLRRHERGQGRHMDVTHYIDACRQCDSAPCVNAATVGAIKKRADGIVLIDPEVARGRRDLVDACPYGQIHWNEETKVPQNWNFDAHLIDQGWDAPRCVSACPTEAIEVVRCDDQAMAVRCKRDGLTTPDAGAGGQPRIYFRNGGTLTSLFVAGTLRVEAEGRVECASGIEVRMETANGQQSTISDWMGDFKFENISPDSGDGVLSLSGRFETAKPIRLTLGDCSVDLGEILVRK